MQRSFVTALAGAAANVVVAAAASANPTAYNVAPLLQARDAFADRFWGLLQGPVAPAQPPATQGQLYDFRQVLGQPDPFAQRFYGQTISPPPASLRRRIADAVVALGAHIDRDAVDSAHWPTAA